MQLPEKIESPVTDWEQMKETFRKNDPEGKFEVDIIVELTKILIEKNMSKRELARRCDVSHSTISRIFNFEASMNLTTFIKICLVLDLKIDITSAE